MGISLPSEDGLRCPGLSPESQGQNLALSVLYVPYSLDSGSLNGCQWLLLTKGSPSPCVLSPHHAALLRERRKKREARERDTQQVTSPSRSTPPYTGLYWGYVTTSCTLSQIDKIQALQKAKDDASAALEEAKEGMHFKGTRAPGETRRGGGRKGKLRRLLSAAAPPAKDAPGGGEWPSNDIPQVDIRLPGKGN